MERPIIRVGSPLPVTPSKRRRPTVEDLLQSFQARRSLSSVTRERTGSLRQSMSASSPVVSLATPSVSPSPPSLGQDSPSDSGTPKTSHPAEDIMEPESDKTPKALERCTSSRRSARVAPKPNTEDLANQSSCSTRSERRSGRASKIILRSDALPSNEPQTAISAKLKQQSVRNRIRSDIAASTKVKANNYFVAKKDYFLPLLPENNYISRLAERSTGEIIEYRSLKSQPQGIRATLKPYQLEGLSFLVHLYENGMSGLLGDEMGLGKTLQTLALFQYIEEQEAAKNLPTEEIRPYLVVCPLSVISSWVAEAERWTPDLKVLRFHGPVSARAHLKRVALGLEDRYGNATVRFKKRGRQTANAGQGLQAQGFNIVITTYETFAAEKSFFKTSFVWRYIVLDEGHRIKNDLTQVSAALQGLKAEYRLILTGTPLQNNLQEMWGLLHWLYPDVFTANTQALFRESFDLTRGKVSTSVIDDARRLLELVMLRRMKDSPGVDLGLPPKEEVFLYVPLTPMQRFWYTRLLTRAGDSLLQELFKDASNKERVAIKAEIEDEKWLKLEDVEQKHGVASDKWQESREIMQQALEHEKHDSTAQNAWRRLMNLLMQLRKCCSHPYLLANASPDPYYLGDHIIQASGKFIVLKKLLEDLILNKGKKVLIFSGFTKTLDYCEDLLYLLGGGGEKFRYLRLDGSTVRARRNLGIRVFNEHSSQYKVMLISTRAGGLGINLTSSSDVIFMDEDWNPQITLQAEARVHRIGQTKPCTIYKLCTQGTVEEQMLGRIRKKLYLSAKVTESMSSVHSRTGTKKTGRPSVNDDMPQMSTNQLKTLIRRGAQTLSHQEIDVTEMLTWDLNTVLEKCRDKPSDLQVEQSSAAEVDEESWLSAMERVEIAVFDGKHYKRGEDNGNSVLSDGVTRADRRVGKNTTVMVDGYAVTKESTNCGDWEAVPTFAGKDPRLASPKREKKPEIENQETCHICYDGGQIVLCSSCPRSYHRACLKDDFDVDVQGWRNFYCPQHECFDCQKKTTDAGGLIFRCRWCPRGYCEDCLRWDKTTLVGDQLIEYEMLGFPEQPQAFYIVCPSCNDGMAEDNETRRFLEAQEALYQKEYEAFLKNQSAEDEEEAAREAALERQQAEIERRKEAQRASNASTRARENKALLGEQAFPLVVDDSAPSSAVGSSGRSTPYSKPPSQPSISDTSSYVEQDVLKKRPLNDVADNGRPAKRMRGFVVPPKLDDF